MFNVKLVNGTNRCLWCWCRALLARQRHLTQTLICLDTLKGSTMTHTLRTRWERRQLVREIHWIFIDFILTISDQLATANVSIQSRQALISCLQLAWSCQLPVNTWFWPPWKKASKRRKDLESNQQPSAVRSRCTAAGDGAQRGCIPHFLFHSI